MATVHAAAEGSKNEARHGGSLNWIVTPEPASFIPLTTTAGTNAELGPKVVEGLLTYDDDLNPLPLLATQWEISDDGLQYPFTLREGDN
ncbi:MAG: ABC transporter substrate-binding protein, partial [Alcaligenaceae bacterium]|nr:ABC transporter substrate-binding protein [Alcaligenaceae bacterium]